MSKSTSLQKINSFILDTLFPITCLSCQKENTWLCEKCLKNIPILSVQVCPYCEKVTTENGAICEKCQKLKQKKEESPALDGLISATDYAHISKLVHLFKYNFISEIGEPLAKIMVLGWNKNNLPIPDLVIPIPIHNKKLKWRGFNQAKTLAQKLTKQKNSSLLNIPICTNLIFRQRKTAPQMKIKSYQERLINLENAFAIFPNIQKNLAGKNILLVDDIATTGATLFECAKALKLAGAKKVYAIIIARQKL